MSCVDMFLSGSWPAHNAVKESFPGWWWSRPAEAGKTLLMPLLSNNTASRWLPLSFIPDWHFKPGVWLKESVLFLLYFECLMHTSKHTPFLYPTRYNYIHTCICRMLFLAFSHDYSPTIAVIEAQTETRNTLFSSYCALATLFRKTQKALYSLRQILVHSNFSCSTLSNQAARNSSSFCRSDLMSLYPST